MTTRELKERPAKGTRFPVDDVLCLAIPDPLAKGFYDAATGEVHEDLQSWLDFQANLWALEQYKSNFPIPLVSVTDVDWLVTSDPAKAEEFQPAHDCAECRQGVEKVHAYLAEHPDALVALANIKLVETW